MMRMDRLVTPWAQRTPAKVAVQGMDESLTYAELDAMANRFARLLQAHGLRPGDRVGVHLPRTGRGVAAMVGTLRAGGVFVPLDPSSPPPRMKLIITDCGIRHVFISPTLLTSWLAADVCAPVEHFFLSADAAPPKVPDGVTVHSWSEQCAASASALPSPGDDEDELAYMLYTSGSTGVPKGVMLSHRNCLAFSEWAADQISLTEHDRVASVAPFHFDLSTFDLWSSLSRGSTVVVVDETTVVSGKRMLDRIHEANINVWYSVPSAIMLMLENGGLEERGAPLRSVFFAGEVFPIKHLVRAMNALPKARFFNLFGPTETNVCLGYEMPAAPAADATVIPIGFPSCGDVCTIVDEQGNPVPEGEKGELFVDGPTIMLGYWDGGRRTAAKHPYPTGDLVTKRPDGAYMYHGRRDHMVKIHGFRVELGEVEAALLEHTGIKEAIAMAHDQKLVVVAIPTDGSVSVLELKQHCAKRLPRYMIPSDFRLVQELPRTSSGKIDRVRTKNAVIEGDQLLLQPVQPTGKDSPWKSA